MIKYRFALDTKDNLIDIRNLERNELSKDDIFFSIDFKQLLIPRLGKIKTKHFAHKPNIDILGSSETYLHALGKKIFYSDYSNCLQTKTPFYINYTIQKHCNRLEQEYEIICNLKQENEKFDLTRYFTEILIEKKDDTFIPDILLVNPYTKEKIYIEMAVTHLVSDEKKHSKHRIVEFILANEEDAEKLIEFKVGNFENEVNYYNFKTKQIVKPFCRKGNCCHEFNLFIVSSNGKCNLKVLKEKEIATSIENYTSNSIWHILEPAEQLSDEDYYYGGRNIKDIFIGFVRKANREKVNIRNCYICRYHAENKSWDFVDGEPIFCKFLKITCGSNYAVQCQFFKIEQSYI